MSGGHQHDSGGSELPLRTSFVQAEAGVDLAN
jgi:hypothetical protein